MIPMPHKIELLRMGEPDIWGESTIEETVQLNGNIRSRTQVVTNSYGEEVISNYRVLFHKFVDVKTKDKIRFTEPNGEVIESEPIQVKFMRDLDGSVAFTKAVL